LLISGKLENDEYVRFLMMLWHVYSELESGLTQHSSHPVINPTYNNTLLARRENLSADISYLLQEPEAFWRSHPLHIALMESPPPALTAYILRLQEISQSSDPSPLLAHAYVRYLGDLSGGQQIRRVLCKAYGLEDGAGLSFYEFKSPESKRPCTIGEMRKIKEWYREGMDASVTDADGKAALLEEAITAFEYNAALYDASGPLSSAARTEDIQDAQVIKQGGSQQERGAWNVSSVISVIIAMSLAHFVLVVGGFTGTSGSAKFQALQSWLVAQ